MKVDWNPNIVTRLHPLDRIEPYLWSHFRKSLVDSDWQPDGGAKNAQLSEKVPEERGLSGYVPTTHRQLAHYSPRSR
jgi:hypothetical protein